MTESVGRLGVPSQFSEWGDRLARTYERTYSRSGYSSSDESFSSATRTTAANRFIDARSADRQNQALTRDSQNRWGSYSRGFAPHTLRTGSADPAVGAPTLDRTPTAELIELRNAQGLAGAPLATETNRASVTATTPLTRRVQASQVGALRHHSLEGGVACSPVARWHGESDGSDPCRPPTSCSAASRSEVDCASLASSILSPANPQKRSDTTEEFGMLVTLRTWLHRRRELRAKEIAAAIHRHPAGKGRS